MELLGEIFAWGATVERNYTKAFSGSHLLPGTSYILLINGMRFVY